MSLVGEFPGFQEMNRRTVRAPINPLDVSTVISILPKHIVETKITLTPSIFELHPGSFDKPSLLVVTTGSWWKEMDPEQPLLEITQSSIQIADSVVKDYCVGLIACNMNDLMPGLSFLPGNWTVEKLKKEQGPLLNSMLAKQRNWYKELIRMADIMWSRTNGNPLAISDDARLACKELNISNKPWLGDLQAMELVRCVACGSMRNPSFPICPTCKAVADPVLAKQLNLSFAQ